MTGRFARSRGLRLAAALLCLGTLTGCEAYDLPLPGSPVDEDEAFEVTATFRDVLDLVPRSPVKVNDVTVGEIVEIRRVGWEAEAVLRVQEDVELPENAIADIRQTSLLGEKYVALEAPPSNPSDKVLSDGDTIGLDRTGRNPELEEVLGALALVLNGGGIGQMHTIISEINKVFDGRQDRARHVLGELEILVGGLDEQKEDIIAAMQAMNGLARTLNAEKDTVTTALDEFGPAVTVLADQREQLMEMLEALDRLGAVGTRVISASKESLLADLRHLQPILREIANADDQIPEALGLLISFPFPIESNNIVHGDYANTEIVFSMDLHQLFANPGDSPVPGGGGPKIPSCEDIPNPELGDVCRTATGKIIEITEDVLDQLTGGGDGPLGEGPGGGGVDVPGLGFLGRQTVTGHEYPHATTLGGLLGGVA